jgi:E3 ubiquitin-protein ligase SHPRH
MDAGDGLLTIDQVESLRCKASYYWPSKLYHEYTRGYPCEFRPALNLNTIISLLSPNEELGGDTEDEMDEDPPELASSRSDGNCHPGNKRHRSASPSSPSKRQKINNEPEQEQEEQEESDGGYTDEYREPGCGEDYVEPEYKQIYPSYWNSFSDVVDESDVAQDTSFFQVYQYAVDLRYNTSIDDNSEHYANNRSAEKWGWLKEEERLLSLVETRRKDMSLAQNIDMGRFYITRYYGRLLALSGKPEAPYDHCQETIKERSERWLLLLPDTPWPDDVSTENLEQYDMQPSGMHREFTTACAVLQAHDRGKLETNLRLHILPEGTYDPTCELPFRLHAHFTLSLAIPTIYKPFNNSFNQRQINELEGLQRRLVCFLSKTPLSRPVPTNATNELEVRDATIPFFLSIMRPAPPLSEGVTYESLQPDGLIPTLLPFQRRTVAWMLEREGKMITPEGTVVPAIDSTVPDPDSGSNFNMGNENIPVFWEKIVMGGQEFFFNRLTGAVSSSLTEPHTALGGILAEEPGASS